MNQARWIGVCAGLVLVAGCGGPRTMSYDQLDATRANAANALMRANEALGRIEALEARIEELEERLGG
jgi:hypothetical protein